MDIDKLNLLKLDGLALSQHVDLEKTDKCYYWRQYTPGMGYNFSTTNQLIHNFQIPILENHRKHHKEGAIKQIAKEFAQVLIKEQVFRECTFVPMPTSKPYNHPEYDDRLCRILHKVAEIKQINMDIRQLVFQTSEMKPSKTGHRLSADELDQIYKLDRSLISPKPKAIIVFDDVLTKGSHFKAMQKTLKTEITFANVTIIGIFIALSSYVVSV